MNSNIDNSNGDNNKINDGIYNVDNDGITKSDNIDDVTINLSELDKRPDHPKTMLHTASTTINSKEIKIIIDTGSDATVVTKNCVDKLKLTPKKSTRILNIKTLTGKKQTSSSSVEIEVKDNVKVQAFVLDSNLMLEPAKINLAKWWPALDKNLAREVKKNVIGGKIDIVIGVDQLYGKNIQYQNHTSSRKRLSIDVHYIWI